MTVNINALREVFKTAEQEARRSGKSHSDADMAGLEAAIAAYTNKDRARLEWMRAHNWQLCGSEGRWYMSLVEEVTINGPTRADQEVAIHDDMYDAIDFWMERSPA